MDKAKINQAIALLEEVIYGHTQTETETCLHNREYIVFGRKEEDCIIDICKNCGKEFKVTENICFHPASKLTFARYAKGGHIYLCQCGADIKLPV